MRQLAYKSVWHNHSKIIKVDPKSTSSKCAICGGTMIDSEEHRMLKCPNGNVTVDRDVNASMNILVRGPKVGLVGFVNEAMVSRNHEMLNLMVETLADTNQLQFSSAPK